ncbi:MAG: hypothetical protein LIP01_11285, partial [Tannerellaceae bacterium]|nr:hypothetical protein [Tannerellaceae bacterium]
VKVSEQFLSKSYENVYISQERKLEIILLKKIRRKNVNCRFFSVEEDSYYTLEREPLRPGQKIKISVKKPIENVLHLVLYHETTNDRRYMCYGMSPITSFLYVLFPDVVREELRYKTIKECTAEMLAAGIEGLYGEPLDEKKSGLIIVSDLIERYRNREEIVSLFNEIAAFCEESGIELYIKYHPRETNKIQTECRIQELSTGVAVEKLYLDFNESKTVVLGNMSTSVLTAKKLGFKTISIMKMNDPQQNIISAYEKIGIEMPVSNNEMLSFIADGLKLRR